MEQQQTPPSLLEKITNLRQLEKTKSILTKPSKELEEDIVRVRGEILQHVTHLDFEYTLKALKEKAQNLANDTRLHPKILHIAQRQVERIHFLLDEKSEQNNQPTKKMAVQEKKVAPQPAQQEVTKNHKSPSDKNEKNEQTSAIQTIPEHNSPAILFEKLGIKVEKDVLEKRIITDKEGYITEADLTRVNLTTEKIKVIIKLQKITKIGLNSSDITDELLEELTAQVPQIEDINLSNIKGLTNQGLIRALKNLRAPTRILLGSTNLNDTGTQFIKECNRENMTFVNISKTFVSHQQWKELQKQYPQIIFKAENLKQQTNSTEESVMQKAFDNIVPINATQQKTTEEDPSPQKKASS